MRLARNVVPVQDETKPASENSKRKAPSRAFRSMDPGMAGTNWRIGFA